MNQAHLQVCQGSTMSSHVPEQPRGQKLWQEPNDSERGRPWGLRRAPVTLTRGVTAPWQPSVPLPSSQQGSNLSLASRHYKHSKDIHFLRAAFSRLQVPALGTPCPHNPYKSQGVPFPVQPSVTFFQTPTNAPGTSPTAEPYSPSPLPRFAIGSRNAFSSVSPHLKPLLELRRAPQQTRAPSLHPADPSASSERGWGARQRMMGS